MIMLGLKFMGDVPFREVYIHGLVRDAEGQKMSKSKGNVLDPIDLIDGIDLDALVAKRTGDLMQPQMAKAVEKTTRKHFPDGIPAFGTDALRFTFCALASPGRNVNFDLGRIEGYRNFCNKLWNAARYVLMNTEGQDCGQTGGESSLTAADRWILSRLQTRIGEVQEAVESYRFDLAAQAIYEFTWSEYCDWYLELSKPVLVGKASSPDALRGTRQTLVHVLETLLRLAHPMMPFITEEIWQRVAPLADRKGQTIMLERYPAADDSRHDREAEAAMRWVMDFILGVRRIRGEMNISPGKPLSVLLQHGSAADRANLDAYRLYLERLARLETITWLDQGDKPPQAATALVGAMKILIPMAGLIDKEAELRRLAKEIEKLDRDLSRSEGKLANDSFVDRAPPEVVAKERARVAEFHAAKNKLLEQKARIETL